jgi:eukaryotic-like serine/threonine-protein kinase
VNESQIFAGVMKLADAAERAAYLDQACAGNPQMRAAVEALLQAHASDPDFLEQHDAACGSTEVFSPNALAGDEPARNEQPGEVLAGRYKLLEEIGTGGMGSVWMAQQQTPVKRLVAVKLIKAGMDSQAVLARFDAERQALALMDHPNIAKVFDAGTVTETAVSTRPDGSLTRPLGTGRPFFVMELVKGVPITQYCDAHHLTPRQRLELFVPVCQAIQHAHQKGIIHRDIKPSNVLVALYDDRPVPKVIDFGVAKATGQQLTEQSLHTGFGQVVGTLEYMSPEQATFNQLDVDTRSDIYSLGVLLYELLAGSPPFTRKELEKAGMLEMLRVIREQEPPKPSTKLSTAEGLPSLAANRGTEPKRLTALVRGELDWIVMKALEKDRARRYETANGLAMDVQCYLADEPVLAGPPSTRYRLRKFIQRHKGPVLSMALVLATLLVGIVGTTWGMVRAAARAEGERLANLEAQAQKSEAIAARDREAKERGYAETLLDFIIADILALTGVEEQTRFQAYMFNKNTTLRELLNRATQKIKNRKGLDPRSESGLCWIIGVSYRAVGEHAQAIPLLERCLELDRQRLGPDEYTTLKAQNSLALAYRFAGKYDLALPLFEETIKVSRANLGLDHIFTLCTMDNLAGMHHEAGNLDVAIALFEKTLHLKQAKLGTDHAETLATMNNLAGAYEGAGKLDLALALYKETLKFQKAKLDSDHPYVLVSMNNLASAYHSVGKLDLALPLLEETFKLMKKKLGPDHPNTLNCMNNLGLAYQDAGKRDLALPLFEEAFKGRKALLGPDHHETLVSMSNLATAFRNAGKFDVALALHKESVSLAKARLGPDHPSTLNCMSCLAVAYWSAKQLDKSIPLFENVLQGQEAILGRQHPHTLQTAANLGVNYKDAGRLAEALPLLEEGYRAAKKHPRLIRGVGDRLFEGYVLAGKKPAAVALAMELLADARKQLPRDSSQFAKRLVFLGSWLLDVKAFAEAEPIFRECLTLHEKIMPDHWATCGIKSVLGGALLSQKKYAEAEPLLLQSYEGLKQRETKIPLPARGVITDALGRLIRLYDALDKKDEAAKWRKELEAHQKKLEMKP